MNAYLLLIPVLLILLTISYLQYSSLNTIVTPISGTPSRSDLSQSSPRRTQGDTALITTPTPRGEYSFDLEDEDNCAGWTFKSTLFPSNEQHLQFNTNGSMVHANWDGLIPLDIYYPFQKGCVHGKVRSSKEAKQTVRPSNMLCTYDRLSDRNKNTQRSTLIIEMIDDRRAWDHLFRDIEHLGLNLWHFHVDYFAIWLAIRRLDVTSRLLLQNETFSTTKGAIFPEVINPIVDLVFIFPDFELQRFAKVEDTRPVVYNGTNARQLYENGGKFSAIAGVQGVHDGLSPESKVIIGRYSTTTMELQDVLLREGLNPRPAAWFKPLSPTFLLWMLERHDLEGDLDQCKDSVIAQYATHLLNSVPIRHKTKRATHICMVSRQTRARIGNEQPVRSRNLMPDVFLELIKRLSSPIVLSPQIYIRDGRDIPIPSHLSETSVTGQMRFVHQECAVLFGVHGAGLANVFGMRPGTHLIELLSAFNYSIFKNSALLLNNVSYTRLTIESEMVDRGNHFEANFTMSESRLSEVVDTINEALKDSIARQKILSKLTDRQQMHGPNHGDDDEDGDDDFDEDDDVGEDDDLNEDNDDEEYDEGTKEDNSIDDPLDKDSGEGEEAKK